MKKTLSMRLLEQHGIPYEVISYHYDPKDLNVQKIAQMNNLEVSHIYKTLVAKGDKSGLLVAVIPGHQRLNRKAIARVSQNKKVGLLDHTKLLEHTGFIRGGCGPLGMKKNFPTYFDVSAKDLGEIWVNAGQRGILIQVNIEDLVRLTEGQIVPIAEAYELNA